MNREPQNGISWMEVAIATALGLLLLGLILPAFQVTTAAPARMTQASNNARQIIVCFKAWAGENNGAYPDAYEKNPPKTANEALRLLIKSGIIEDERIFTAPASPYWNDNSIGDGPDYLEALEPGENHWCIVKGLDDYTNGSAPLIFENPASNTWPPVWDCDVAGLPKPGRAWKGGKIVVGLNDGSVTPQMLEASKGSAVPLEKDEDGKDLFTRWRVRGEYLDIE